MTINRKYSPNIVKDAPNIPRKNRNVLTGNPGNTFPLFQTLQERHFHYPKHLKITSTCISTCPKHYKQKKRA